MAGEPNEVELAVSRTLRDNLGKIQQTAEELRQSINDLVSACASNRPTNALPPMVRAQTSAASLSAALEVLSRFVTAALQPALRSPFEQETLRMVSNVALPSGDQRAPAVEQPEPEPAHPIQQSVQESAGSAPEPVPEPDIVPPLDLSAVEAVPSAGAPPAEPIFSSAPVPVFVYATTSEVEPAIAVEPQVGSAPPEAAPRFTLDSLPPDEQELHRRAYRVAKVSMQDIKLLHPEDVRIGRENKDLCFRLRDEIEKAHKEYDRRFQSLRLHPVDYFYDWMVEILAGGNPEALGEYPYPSPILRR